ncbi:Asp-tRNA(Asn)/Glu-tRNA(Gln) amidotransferase subunit GatC [Patescibacteria group bacterium]|jgi:aspartyl-tRNA(Asn)/glutamyl-tRNA(Gln) amidotransferase subunit C|nr:Asp-tRNA(Asn)/Glu-tRNA(Gln) amidotransferase subunit GatC [Patescibacteria group bacterium]
MATQITDEEIRTLARLARIEVAEAELPTLREELSAILGYVSELNELAGGGAADEHEVDLVYNVLREDTDPTEPGTHTEQLLAQVARRKGDHLSVTKIIQND